MPRLIGLSGYAQSGKDTLAGFLVKDHGFTRVAFADKLREALYALNPRLNGDADSEWRLQDEVDLYGWEYAKKDPEVRTLLQRMGTEAGRAIHGPDLWVDAAFRGIEEADRRTGQFPLYVFTDCRFPSEADAIVARGGIVVRVVRRGFEPVNAHPSETALDDYKFDAYVQNDGPISDLAWAAERLAL